MTWFAETPGTGWWVPGSWLALSPSRASTTRWSPGLAGPFRSLHAVCERLSVFESSIFLCLSFCPFVCPRTCACSTVRQRRESPCLSTSKGGGSCCHSVFFQDALRKLPLFSFLSRESQLWASGGEASFDFSLPNCSNGAVVAGWRIGHTSLTCPERSVSMVLEGLLLFTAVRKKTEARIRIERCPPSSTPVLRNVS